MPDHLENNLEIIKRLEKLLRKHPEQRFSQALLNFGFVKEVIEKDGALYWKDEFYVEPETILTRITPDPK